MKNEIGAWIGGVCLFVCAFGGMPPAWAQTDSARVVEEIIVTARKREESLQDVPAAVTAISNQLTRDALIFDTLDLQNLVPNMKTTESRSSGTLSAFIRGIGQSDIVLTSDPGVGIYFDGVYLSRPQGAVLKIFDLERIEVLKGPQGTLYGRNTIGGAINYISRKPTDDLRLSVEASLGSFDTNDIRGSISGPIIPGKFYGSFGAGSFNHEPIQTRVSVGDRGWSQDISAARGSLLLKANPQLQLTLSGDVSRDRSAPKFFGTFVHSPVYQATRPDVEFRVPADEDEITNGGESEFYVDSDGLSLVVDYDVTDAVSMMLTAANRNLDYVDAVDLDGVTARILDFSGRYEQEQHSVELQFNYADGGPLDIVAGLFWLESEDVGELQNSVGRPLAPVDTWRVQQRERTVETAAAYGNVKWSLTNSLRLTLGIRFSEEDGSYDNARQDYAFLPDGFVFPFDPMGQSEIASAAGGNEQSWSSTTPQLGLDYRIDDDAMIYASYSEGFKAGGFNEREGIGLIAQEYDPEEVKTYAIGFKTEWFSDSVVANAEFFYNDYTDLQVLSLQAFESGGQVTSAVLVSNAGEAITKGAEVELQYRWINGTAYLNVGHLRAKYVEYDRLNVQTNEIENIADITNYSNAPEWTASIGGNVDFSLGRFGILRLAGNAGYRSDEFRNSPEELDGYTIVNLSLGIHSPSDQVSLSFEGANLLDERPIIGFADIIGYQGGNYMKPRMLRATLRYDL